MGERTNLDALNERARRVHPAGHIAGGATVATALTLGIPQLVDYFSARDAAETDAHVSHIETLGLQLEKCEVGRQTCMDRLLDCHNVPISAGAPGEWDGEDWP